MPRVSIGMPVYNGQNYVSQAIESILSQTYTDFELVISDNASEDATEDICREYAGRDQRICYYRNEKNLGAAFNFNRTFELSKGQYFKWVGHDDVCIATYLEKCVAALDESPDSVILSYPKVTIIDKDGDDIGKLATLDILLDRPTDRLSLLLQNMPPCTAVFGLIRSDVLRKTRLIGGYFASDNVLLAELSLLGKFKEVGEYLFHRRKHDESSLHLDSTIEGVAVWFDPSNKGRIIAPRTRLFRELLRAINRSGLSWTQKLVCYAIVMKRWFPGNWKMMVKEIAIPLRLHSVKRELN